MFVSKTYIVMYAIIGIRLLFQMLSNKSLFEGYNEQLFYIPSLVIMVIGTP
jgi:hypothetical protein